MAIEIFANQPSTAVASGGTTAPSAGTVETWTVASSGSFPAASSTAKPPSQFHVADPALPGEIIAVTNVSGPTWTVTRGAESTVTVAHTAGFAVQQVVTAGALTAMSKPYTLYPSGDTSGATDAALINAYIAAGVQELILAPGQWYTGTNRISLTAGPAIKITGSGSVMNDQSATNATVINCGSGSSSTGLFFFSHTATLITGTEIGNLDIIYAGTGNVFDDVNLQSGWFHDLHISLSDAASTAFFTGPSETVNNSVIHCMWERVSINITSTSRTSPMISLTSQNSGGISDVTFWKCKFNSTGDNHQPLVLVQCTATGAGYHYATTFRDCYFEKPIAGAIKSLSGSGLLVDSCMFWDMSGLSPSGSTVYVGAASGNIGSQGVRILGCGRNRAGPNGSSAWDVYCESTTSQVLVQGFHILAAGQSTATNAFFNFNACKDVALIGNVFPQGSSVNGNSTTVVTNPPAGMVNLSGGIVTGYLADAGGMLFDVKAPPYKAAGDGVTDDTAAIAAAIAAAVAAQRGIVYFPPGTYLVSSSLLPGGGSPGALTILGSGWDSVIKLANASNCYIFDFGLSGSPQYTPGLSIRDLYLNCNGANQSTAGGGIHARGAVWCDFDHLYIDTPWEAGIKFFQDGTGAFGHHNNVTKCTFINGKNANSGTGYSVYFTSCDESYVTGCTIQDCGNASAGENHMMFDTAGLQHITGNSFVGGAAGSTQLKTQGSHCVISGNIFDGCNAGHQLRLNGDRNMVTGNWFYNVGNAALVGSPKSGIFLDNVQRCLISGNMFIPVASGSGYAAAGVNLQFGADHNTIRGNVFTTQGTTGTWQTAAVSYAGGGTHNVIASNDGAAPDVLSPVAPVNFAASPYSASPGQLIPADTTAGAVTVNLPAAPPDGSVAAVKLVIQGGSNAVTIAAAGSDVFNKASGSTSMTLALPNQAILLQYSAAPAIWYVLADDLPLSQMDSRYVAQSSLPLAITSGGTGAATLPAGLLKGAGTGAITAAASGSDYAPATSGTSALKGNGSGGFSSAVLNDVGAATGDYSLNSHKITSLATPAASTDAASKGYVDGVAQGLSVKTSAVAATTGSETFAISSGNVTQITGTTIDGQSPAVSDYILVKDAPAATGTGSAASTQPGNGLYQVTSNTTNLSISRAAAMSGSNPPAGVFVFVEGGTANASSGWVTGTPSTSAAFTYGTNNIQFVQFSGAGEITAGTGLAKSGNTLSIENSGVLALTHGGTGQASAAAALSALGGAAVAGDIGGTSASPTVTGTHLGSALPLAQGGTGQATQQTALDALAGAQANHQVLAGDGTHVTLRALATADLPTVAIAQGGTGQTSQQAAINALAGAQTNNRVLAGDGANITVRALAAADLPAATTGAQGAVKLPAASLNVKPSNPASTTSTTLVMMGMGGTAAYTPSSSGLVMVIVTGNAYINTATQSVGLGPRYGTGTAPSNAAAVTGTRWGTAGDPSIRPSSSGATNGLIFAFNDILALTPATAYWFDVAISTTNASDGAFIQNVSFSFVELVS